MRSHTVMNGDITVRAEYLVFSIDAGISI